MRTKSKLENIEKFKRLHYYNSEGEISAEKAESLGLDPEPYSSLDDQAYQVSYDLSNDWAKDEPYWDDIRESYKLGVEDGLEYILNCIEKYRFEGNSGVQVLANMIKKHLNL